MRFSFPKPRQDFAQLKTSLVANLWSTYYRPEPVNVEKGLRVRILGLRFAGINDGNESLNSKLECRLEFSGNFLLGPRASRPQRAAGGRGVSSRSRSFRASRSLRAGCPRTQ